MLQGKEIIEYYLRELEEEGVTYIPRWTPPVISGSAAARLQLQPPSTARAIPVNGAKNGLDSKDPACPTELVAGSPDGQCLLASHLFKCGIAANKRAVIRLKCVSFISFLCVDLFTVQTFTERTEVFTEGKIN